MKLIVPRIEEILIVPPTRKEGYHGKNQGNDARTVKA